MKEMAEMTQKPNITQKARARGAKGVLFAEHARAWQLQREERVTEKANELLTDELKTVQASPSIDSRSARMVEQLEYHGPISGWETHFAKFCARKASAMKQDVFQPNINANALRKDVSVDISTRLFNEAEERKVRLNRLALDVREKEMLDPCTGLPLFQPQALPIPQELPRPTKEYLAEYLFEKGAELEAKKLRLAQQVIAEQTPTFKPQINAASAALAKGLERQPLHLPRRQSPARTHNHQPPAVSPQQSGSSPPSADEVVRRIQQAAMARELRLQEVRRTVESEQSKQCTFKPRINRVSLDMFRTANSVDLPTEEEMGVGQNASSRTAQSRAFAEGVAALRQPRFSESGKRHTDPLSPPPKLASSMSPFPTQPQQTPGNSHPRIPPVDTYISNFEKQMVAVLDEWRKLEGD